MPEIPRDVYELRQRLVKPCPACGAAREQLLQLLQTLYNAGEWGDKAPRLMAGPTHAAVEHLGCRLEIHCAVCQSRGIVLADDAVLLLAEIGPVITEALAASPAAHPESERAAPDKEPSHAT